MNLFSARDAEIRVVSVGLENLDILLKSVALRLQYLMSVAFLPRK